MRWLPTTNIGSASGKNRFGKAQWWCSARREIGISSSWDPVRWTKSRLLPYQSSGGYCNVSLVHSMPTPVTPAKAKESQQQ